MSDDDRLILGFLAWMERERGAVLRRNLPEPGQAVTEMTDWETSFYDFDLWWLVRAFCVRPDRRAPLPTDSERVEYLEWFDEPTLPEEIG